MAILYVTNGNEGKHVEEKYTLSAQSWNNRKFGVVKLYRTLCLGMSCSSLIWDSYPLALPGSHREQDWLREAEQKRGKYKTAAHWEGSEMIRTIEFRDLSDGIKYSHVPNNKTPTPYLKPLSSTVHFNWLMGGECQQSFKEPEPRKQISVLKKKSFFFIQPQLSSNNTPGSMFEVVPGSAWESNPRPHTFEPSAPPMSHIPSSEKSFQRLFLNVPALEGILLISWISVASSYISSPLLVSLLPSRHF